jgi:hypothetical protein
MRQAETASSAPSMRGAVGEPPVATKTRSGFGANGSLVRARGEADLDALLADLAFQPAHDPRQVLAPGHALGQIDLPAEPRLGLEQDDLMSALGGHAGRLHSAGPPPTMTVLRALRRPGVDVGQQLASLPVAAFWMHLTPPLPAKSPQ